MRTYASFIALLCLNSRVFAQEIVKPSSAQVCNPTSCPISHEDKRTPRTIAEFGFSAAKAYYENEPSVKLRRLEPYIRLENRFLRFMYVFVTVKTDMTALTIYDDYPLFTNFNLRAEADLSSRWSIVTGGGTRFILWRNPQFLLELDGAFEQMPSSDTTIEAARVSFGDTEIDGTALLQQSVDVAYDWRRVDAGLKLRWDPDFFVHPYARVGFVKIKSKVRFNYRADVLEQYNTSAIGYSTDDLPRFIILILYAPMIDVGADVPLWGPLNLRVSGSGVPFGGESTWWSGTLSIVVHE